MTTKSALEHYLVLPLGVLIAMVWAGTLPLSYFAATIPLTFVVNDVGMAFALAYLAQEAYEAAMPGGTLHPWHRAVVPIAAAIGGAIGAVVVYTLFIHTTDEDVLIQGWPIVCAVDILFCVATARAIFGRGSAATFLLLVALVSDVLGLAVISRNHYQFTTVHPAAAILILLAIAGAVILRKTRPGALWLQIAGPGLLSWFGFYWSGLHPSLALLPIVPFLPHAPRVIDARPDRGPHLSTHHLEHVLEYPMQVFAFLFGLINAGVLYHESGTGTWAIVLADLVGRPIGVLAATGLAVAAGLWLPRRVSWRELLVVALAVSPGFAFGLFFAASIFPVGPLLDDTKLGALITMLGLLIAVGVARALRVGRFAGAAAVSDSMHGHPIRGIG